MLVALTLTSSGVFFLLLIPNLPQLTSMIIVGVYILFATAMPPLIDRLVLEDLTAKGYSKDLYSRQRLFCTIAYGIVTFGVGYFIKLYGYHVMFISLAIFAAVFVGYTLLFTRADPKSEHIESTQNSAGGSSPATASDATGTKEDIEALSATKESKPSIWTLLSDFNYIFFLVIILINGFARFFLSFFLNLYFTENVKMNPVQSSIAAIMGLLFEIAIFFKAKDLLSSLGIHWMLILGQLAMTVRLWIYYVIPPRVEFLYVFLCVELLKGINFGFIQPSAVKLSSQYAPPGLMGTCQGIYNGVFTGLGGFTAGMFAKLFMTPTNFASLLLVVASISTVGLVLFIVKYLLIDKTISLPFISAAKPAKPPSTRLQTAGGQN
ncbi:hypothetical protein DI09_25p180 [Mitosporidium daphniae]|uniref:Major facilitator superfamily associated domain-containing protein n=1 Tax=Mitosporidium daphniae TaxID=1485682 RepID=A0A098VS54_9MICR|nr:uncharacterized protein DI09_25p180 [Mitosporidium daphniae]KGG51858.1 hypothetical protein DI09_25p180 [Mitosporidium daphniae]|eukprot:XP_013238285.1 uncharacterized protein DI09_25p180 [Mitosporidium daphniae]